MLDGVADAITVQSPDQQLIYANAAASRLFGLAARTRPEGVLDRGATCRDFEVLDDTGRPLDVERLPGRLALAGLDPEPIIIARASTARTGEVRWSRVKATGVRDPDGGVRLAINLVEDITELKRSEESQRFLAEASRRLAASTLDYERTLGADRGAGRARAGRVVRGVDWTTSTPSARSSRCMRTRRRACWSRGG